jgi:hypothetical protein
MKSSGFWRRFNHHAVGHNFRGRFSAAGARTSVRAEQANEAVATDRSPPTTDSSQEAELAAVVGWANQYSGSRELGRQGLCASAVCGCSPWFARLLVKFSDHGGGIAGWRLGGSVRQRESVQSITSRALTSGKSHRRRLGQGRRDLGSGVEAASDNAGGCQTRRRVGAGAVNQAFVCTVSQGRHSQAPRQRVPVTKWCGPQRGKV